MPANPASRNWNDVQTAIATVAVVTTIGLWNFFAQPSKITSTGVDGSAVPPPVEPPAASETVLVPQVKIMFTQTAPQTFVDAQPQTVKKKSKKNNNGGSGTVTQTKTS